MSKQSYIKEILETVTREQLSKDKLSRLKVKLCPKHGITYPITDIELLLNAKESDIPVLKKLLLTKPTRSLSGVAPVAIMTKPINCRHGTCVMCPGGEKSVFGSVPKSYTGKEPTTRRAIRNLFDPYLQVMNRLEQYAVTGHNFSKVDLIIMGGTFTSFDPVYREDFVTYTFKAMNDFSDLFFKDGVFNYTSFKEFFELPGDLYDEDRKDRLFKKMLAMKTPTSLIAEQKRNENVEVKCIGLTIETKPDWAKLDEGNDMLRLGTTRVELGVQTVYDDVLKNINRGHTLADTIESIQILKDLGFKLNFHMMLGLPGVSHDMDLHSMHEIFENPDFRPDMIKIYPCMVMAGTPLFNLWKTGKFEPIKTPEAAEIIAEVKKIIPRYCRVMRVQRDIPTNMTESGVDRTNLRQYVDIVTKKKGIQCQCIRCREVGRMEPDGDLSLDVNEYDASNGKEFFISQNAGMALYGFCRMRFPGKFLRDEITPSTAIIRELHVYGKAAALGKQGIVQHRGLGKELLAKAEDIARVRGKNKMIVISGVGVRAYYEKLGYVLEGPYMSKAL